MIIKPRKSQKMTKELDTPPAQKAVVSAPIVHKSEKPQQKIVKTKIETNSIKKAEDWVEEIVETVKVSNKRSLLDEVLEEQAALED